MTPAAPPTPFVVGSEPAIRGEVTGEGTPIVLCHGLTASRRYVHHGSRALERAGHRVIAYDARGHGESDPAPDDEGYGYPFLVADLERVVAVEVGEERFLLGGHSMGAHTAVAYALAHPQRLAGLVLVGPVYTGADREVPQPPAYWDGLAAALEVDGVDGFVAYVDRHQHVDPAARESILGFTRARMLLHRHPEAVAQALREVSRSNPFDSLEQLAELDLPALVVASHDGADPGHPYAVAAAYAEELPQARLISEREGESPLAWQGGKLSRAIADFYFDSLSSSL